MTRRTSAELPLGGAEHSSAAPASRGSASSVRYLHCECLCSYLYPTTTDPIIPDGSDRQEKAGNTVPCKALRMRAELLAPSVAR